MLAALVLVAAFAPLPFTKTWPGATADALGSYEGNPVLTITGAPVRGTTGSLRVTTILATGPDQSVSLYQALSGWLNPKVAVLPRDSVYPQGNLTQAAQEMTQAQDSATTAALNHLHLSADQVKVTVNLGDIGGPSGGQMLSLAIIDKLAGDGHGGDLTGGRNIAGTGTIADDGTVGQVGGVALKTQAAARDGATVFLVPRAECADAKVNTPKQLRLIPVNTLDDSLNALNALRAGAPVPAC
ncbi:PDZ domain-containing protein [Kitasatospora viridis]|uniref:PDZ domain-containing protein n=1 Tax=Kitasatospora viridis TaxID=281105 RepID=A0A561UK81_9ACTN|nr:PDZ domain-containing protein [Kitasatospora viridis]